MLPDQREVIEILDSLRIEVIISSDTSSHSCCVFVEATSPGSGPSPHKHLREEEMFTVLEGRYEICLEGS